MNGLPEWRKKSKESVFWSILENWPENLPICAIGGRGSEYALIATAFSEVGPAEILKKKVSAQEKSSDYGLRTGYLGLLPYSAFHYNSFDKTQLKVYRVSEALSFDFNKEEMSFYRDEKLAEKEIYCLGDVKAFLKKCKPKYSKVEAVSLFSENLEADYLEKASNAIQSIKEGRFYQINFLRYFKAEGGVSRSSLLARMKKNSGPFSAVFDFDDYKVFSLSPERFVKIYHDGFRNKIKAYPIKGTFPRSDLLEEDRENAQSLRQSVKDNAELHMIVDLMRNDLNRICKQGSVKVLSPGELHSFKKVHHLIAEVEGEISSDLSYEDFFLSTLPGGSITGAPKKEVMLAIKELENRDRNFFMGNTFYLGDDGVFDSSILIRTLVSSDGESFEYAAGSGLVLKSKAEAELSEINDKCRVIVEG